VYQAGEIRQEEKIKERDTLLISSSFRLLFLHVNCAHGSSISFIQNFTQCRLTESRVLSFLSRPQKKREREREVKKEKKKKKEVCPRKLSRATKPRKTMRSLRMSD
jgi:hypothetical protein